MKNKLTGLSAGVLWGLDTVVLGVALALSPLKELTLLAPFISTFLHDLASALWLVIYSIIRGQLRRVLHAFKTRSGRFIMLGALLGGPVGMTAYVSAISYIGPAYTAAISAMFPAVGALLARIFLKDKMKPLQFAGLCISIAGVIALGVGPSSGTVTNLPLGLGCGVLCCLGWASEAVICSYGMRDPEVTDELALPIRQTVSAIAYGLVLLPILSAWPNTLSVIGSTSIFYIVGAALAGTASYLCYYRAIRTIGPSKAMALDITYSAWAILFSLILLREIPSVKGVLCAAAIVAGSLLAAGKDKKA